MRHALVAAVALSGCRPEPALPPDAAIDDRPRVRVATFNVRRFFDTSCDSGRCEPGDFEEMPSQAAFDARADQLAIAIRALDADVVALQELETRGCLEALQSRLGDVMPHGAFGEVGFAGSVDVAILSRTAFDRVTGHRDAEPLVLADGRTTTFSRELLEIRTRLHDEQLAVLAAHYRSKADDDPLRRLAEAQVSRRIVDELVAAEPETVAILAGDLNDVPGSPPLAALVDGDAGLVRLADDLPIAEQATYAYGSSRQAIDHLLLARNRRDVRLDRAARVWRGTASFGYAGSDHAALSCDLAF